jgi:hypothetical protein
MRGREDLVPVRFTVECGLTLDLERLNEDPVFRMFCERSSSSPEAVQRYVAHYIGQESILAEMPATCGPADIYRMGVDIAALDQALAKAIPGYTPEVVTEELATANSEPSARI